MKIIMYHYVRPKENSKLRYLDLEDFRAQLSYFEKHFGFLSIEEFKYNILNNIQSNKVLLTFDDGLKDHYKYVLPELSKRQVSAFFFIPSSIFDQRKILNVHKIHHLISIVDTTILLRLIKKKLKNNSILTSSLDKEIYSYSKHEKNELVIKKLLNYTLPFEQSNLITEELFDELKLGKGLFNSLYLNEKEVMELKNNGQVIGSHAFDHQVLSSLSKKQQDSQINHSIKFLKKYMPEDLKTFCFPYGYKMSYNEKTLELLKKYKFDYAFVFDNKENTHFNRLELSRLDCNKF